MAITEYFRPRTVDGVQKSSQPQNPTMSKKTQGVGGEINNGAGGLTILDQLLPAGHSVGSPAGSSPWKCCSFPCSGSLLGFERQK